MIYFKFQIEKKLFYRCPGWGKWLYLSEIVVNNVRNASAHSVIFISSKSVPFTLSHAV